MGKKKIIATLSGIALTYYVFSNILGDVFYYFAPEFYETTFYNVITFFALIFVISTFIYSVKTKDKVMLFLFFICFVLYALYVLKQTGVLTIG